MQTEHGRRKCSGRFVWPALVICVLGSLLPLVAQETRVLDHPRLGQIEIDKTAGQKLQRFISQLELGKQIASGKFAINEIKSGQMSIFVFSDAYASRMALDELNAAYDRPSDAVLLNPKSIPSVSKIQELPDGTAFFLFLLFHELGHREVGATNINRFYYDDAFLSFSQLEEDKADQWAIQKLLSLPLVGAEQRLTLIRNVAEDGLRRYFGVRTPLERVPEQHPSMLYRIGSLYRTAFILNGSTK
jgi:hypothetical protein